MEYYLILYMYIEVIYILLNVTKIKMKYKTYFLI